MITLQINCVTVVFQKPFKGLSSGVINLIASQAPNRIVFIDTPPMDGLVTAIGQVRAAVRGAQVILRDHHDIEGEPTSPRDQQIRKAAEEIRVLLPSATISTRAKHPACSQLVTQHEFAEGGDLIIADVDADGLLAAMKAAGVVYEELEMDAAILDGPRSQQSGLSEFGNLLAKGFATLPPFDAQKPEILEKAQQELFLNFVDAVQGKTAAKQWLHGKVEAYEAAVAEAQRLNETAIEVASGIWFVDTMSAKQFDLSTLAAALEGRPGCRVTVMRKAKGPVAKDGLGQYSLAIPKAKQTEVNVQNFLPSGFTSSVDAGLICNTGFMAHCSHEVWEAEVLPRLKGEK